MVFALSSVIYYVILTTIFKAAEDIVVMNVVMKHGLVIITSIKIFNQRGLSKDGLFYIFKKEVSMMWK